nr:pentapeptide repeat-containing protein [Actinocorallia herbida]
MNGADLHDAELRGADLSNADLHAAELRGTNLRGTDLSGVAVTVEQVQERGAITDEGTRFSPPAKGSEESSP